MWIRARRGIVLVRQEPSPDAAQRGERVKLVNFGQEPVEVSDTDGAALLSTHADLVQCDAPVVAAETPVIAAEPVDEAPKPVSKRRRWGAK